MVNWCFWVVFFNFPRTILSTNKLWARYIWEHFSIHSNPSATGCCPGGTDHSGATSTTRGKTEGGRGDVGWMGWDGSPSFLGLESYGLGFFVLVVSIDNDLLLCIVEHPYHHYHHHNHNDHHHGHIDVYYVYIHHHINQFSLHICFVVRLHSTTTVHQQQYVIMCQSLGTLEGESINWAFQKSCDLVASRTRTRVEDRAADTVILETTCDHTSNGIFVCRGRVEAYQTATSLRSMLIFCKWSTCTSEVSRSNKIPLAFGTDHFMITGVTVVIVITADSNTLS